MALRRDQRPVTDDERAEIRRLHAAGVGRNEIARRIGRGSRTVSEYCQKHGLTFDRTKTAAATEAKMIDAKARRAAIAARLYGLAEADLAYLEGAEKYELIEVSSGQAVQYTPKRLPAQDRRALVQSVNTALASAARLEALDTNNGVDDAKSMLGQLASGLTAAYNAMNEGAGDAP